jgi:hypothetical protein
MPEKKNDFVQIIPAEGCVAQCGQPGVGNKDAALVAWALVDSPNGERHIVGMAVNGKTLVPATKLPKFASGEPLTTIATP